jgi:methyl-accepting chemotaxis protein
MNRKSKIATKLIAYFLGVVIVSLVVVGFITVNKSKNVLKQNLNLTSVQTLQESEKGFNIYLKSLIQQVDLLTRKDEFKHIEDEKTTEHSATYVQDSLLAAAKITDGAIRAYYTTAGGKLINVNIINNNGKKTGEASIQESVNLKNEDWYIKSKEFDGKDGIYGILSKPRIDKESGKKIVTVAQRVGSKESITGIVGIDIEFSKIEDFINNIGLLNTGYAILVDDNGNLLVDNENNIYAKEGITKLPFFDSVKSQNEGHYELKDNGKTVYVVQKKDSTTDWNLMGFVSENEIASNTRGIMITNIISIIVFSILGIIISIGLAVTFNKEIKKINKALRKVADGDFTEQIQITSTNEFGELGENFNDMVKKVSALMKNVESTSSELFEASNNITSMSDETKTSATSVSMAIEEVASGATKQANNTQEANSEIENLSNRLEKSREYTNSINHMSNDTQKLSNKGIDILTELVNKTNKTKENAKLSAEIVSEVSESIDKINYMSNAIAGITEQTNLLSLNASIEAARAGESGKGFAVVADEIRKLAEESKKSTDEIKSIIEEINAKANSAEHAMEESTKMLEEQDEVVYKTKDIFNNILASVTELITGITNINALNQEMYESKNTTVKKMENIAVVSEEIASTSEEVTAAAEEVNATMEELTLYANNLQSMANKLKKEIEQFKLL